MKVDHLEAATNVILGAVINYGLTLLFFGVTAQAAAATTAVFIAVSYGRTLTIRKWYRSRER